MSRPEFERRVAAIRIEMDANRAQLQQLAAQASEAGEQDLADDLQWAAVMIDDAFEGIEHQAMSVSRSTVPAA